MADRAGLGCGAVGPLAGRRGWCWSSAPELVAQRRACTPVAVAVCDAVSDLAAAEDARHRVVEVEVLSFEHDVPTERARCAIRKRQESCAFPVVGVAVLAAHDPTRALSATLCRRSRRLPVLLASLSLRALAH